MLSIKLTVQLRPGLVWQLLLLHGEHAPRKPWPPSNATSSRPLPTTRWRGWHANSCVPLRCWSGSTVSYVASFVKSAALAVRRGPRWPSIYRSSDSMLLVEADLVADLLHALLRLSHSQPLANDTLPTFADEVRYIGDTAGITPLIVVPTHDPHHTLVLKNSGHQAIYDT